jgi:hypothetical protein
MGGADRDGESALDGDGEIAERFGLAHGIDKAIGVAGRHHRPGRSLRGALTSRKSDLPAGNHRIKIFKAHVDTLNQKPPAVLFHCWI